MSLIKSISGIRGTIGGVQGDALTPPDIVAFVSAYAQWVLNNRKTAGESPCRIVVGRDARISGPMVEALVCQTLIACGMDVLSAGLATTPTVEMAVIQAGADGGIILTASHNPAHWNALKLLNNEGEFLSEANGQELLELVSSATMVYAGVDNLGTIREINSLPGHIQSILDLPLVLPEQIGRKGFRVVVDAVNSVGAIAVPELLRALGTENIVLINGKPDGHFAHDPEPLPENLTEIRQAVLNNGADFGIVVDPDVDRLAFVCEDGTFFGEEYTLVAVSDYILSRKPGNTVSNLSSSRALRDITEKHGGVYQASAVGEVNVVEMMKKTGAVIGGEGNGGIIYPELHYGRDALVGIALFMSFLSELGMSLSELRSRYPSYAMSKRKMVLEPGQDPGILLEQLKEKFQKEKIITIDGLKIEFDDAWVHMRKSNTEPIIRIYTEAKDPKKADSLAERFVGEIEALIH